MCIYTHIYITTINDYGFEREHGYMGGCGRRKEKEEMMKS